MGIKYVFSPVGYAGSFSQGVERLAKAGFLKRIWNKEGSVWSDDQRHKSVALNRLGWLDLPTRMIGEAGRLEEFGRNEAFRRLTHIVHLGMGGSSLAPEVMFRSFRNAAEYPELLVLDSTDPDYIQYVSDRVKPESTLFIVASKSGTTVETHSLAKYFYEKLSAIMPETVRGHFLAITDPGTPLQTAGEAKYARVFVNPPDIGGRYSALSYFGLVPFSLLGRDVRRLLVNAMERERLCGPGVPSEECDPVRLGAFLGSLCEEGVNKLTIESSSSVSTVGWWIEQLVAESTGKEGKGILPVAGEEMTVPSFYSTDRVFVYLKLRGDVELDKEEKLRILSASGYPVVTIVIDDLYDLGGLFYDWEIATAAASAIIRVDPFDEPNVTESKENTKRILTEFGSRGKIEYDSGVLLEGRDTVFGNVEGSRDIPGIIRNLFASLKPGEYAAIMAYLPRTPEVDSLLERVRTLLRNRLKIPVTTGYGPRFLHSTGQFHKGGTPNGRFIQITHSPVGDMNIPGEDYGFSTLLDAQAAGDYLSIKSRGKPVISIRFSDYIGGLKDLIAGIV